MIRFAVAHCPACYMRLNYSEVGNFFWCSCYKWAGLPRSEKADIQKSAKKYDKRTASRAVSNG